MQLNTLSLNALTNIRNHLNGTPDGPKMKVSRDKAIEQLQKLAKQKGVALTKAFDESGQPIVVKEEKPAAPAKKAAKKDKAPKAEKGPVIRKVAEELLLQVVGKDDDGRPQGRSYADVLEAIFAKFPEAKTSVACLRWYAVRMRERGEKVPNRPRAKPEVAEQVTE